MSEIWKDIPDYEGIYKISNLGRIKSLERKCKTKGGSMRTIKQRIKKPTKRPDGYLQIQLNKNKKRQIKFIHRLELEVFFGLNNDLQCNHKNGTKDDNRLENLEWMTRSQNVQHAFDVLGRKPANGEDIGTSKLTSKEVREIRNLNGKLLQREIGALYGVNQQNVSNIINNQTWKG